MRNFKLFALALTLFTLFVSTNSNAQIGIGPKLPRSYDPVRRCPYTIRGEFVGEGVGNVSICVSTGLEIPPITLFTGGFFVQPIGVLFSKLNPATVRVTITSITTNGSGQSGISLKINNTVVCQPGSTVLVEFAFDPFDGCPVFN